MRVVGRRTALLLACALFGAACTPLPRPFRAPAPGPTVLPTFLGNDSVLVLPVAGTPGDGGLAFAEETAARLRAVGIPATARPDGGGGVRVAGRIASEAPARPDAETTQVTVIWLLRNRTGAERTIETRERLPISEWQLASPLALSRLAAASVPALRAALRPPDVPPPTGDGPAVALWTVDGAPGDGGSALAAAMRHALQTRGVAIVGNGESDAVLLGSVRRTPVGTSRETFEILWTLILPDGTELGQVRQANTLRTGQLDGVWGPVARAVAEAGADAIAALVRTTVTVAPADPATPAP